MLKQRKRLFVKFRFFLVKIYINFYILYMYVAHNLNMPHTINKFFNFLYSATCPILINYIYTR